MRCGQPADYSSDGSNESDIESCFDSEDEESDPTANRTDVDTDVEGDNRQIYCGSLTRTKITRQNTTSIKRMSLTSLSF